MPDSVIVLVLIAVGAYIAVQLFRALTAKGSDADEAPGGTTTPKSKGKKRKKKPTAEAQGSKGRKSEDGAAIPKVTVEEDEDLELTKIKLPKLSVNDDETMDDSLLPPSSEPNVIPIVFDEDADVDVPTDKKAFFLLSAVGQSEQGRRKKNEDRYLVLEDPPFYAVADGMGGYAGGDLAAKIAVEALEEAVSQPVSDDPSHELPKRAATIVTGITQANYDVFERAQEDKRYAEMGTTIICARFSPHKRRVYIGHVGDSRCYLFRDGAIHQITSDHTLAKIHGVDGPKGKHLVRALGVRASVEIDLIYGRPVPGDRYILCSDGLCRGLDDDEIAEVLRENTTADDAVAALVDGAIQGGTKDNVTVIVVDVESNESLQAKRPDELDAAS